MDFGKKYIQFKRIDEMKNAFDGYFFYATEIHDIIKELSEEGVDLNQLVSDYRKPYGKLGLIQECQGSFFQSDKTTLGELKAALEQMQQSTAITSENEAHPGLPRSAGSEI